MNTCICCGDVIPEGRQVCPNCENKSAKPDVILSDGTHLYLKTVREPEYNPLQSLLHILFKHKK